MKKTAAVLFGVLLPLAAVPAHAGDAQRARGGFVVVAGCDDPAFIASLRAQGGRVIQALDTDPGHVARARARFAADDLYGPVSARIFDGEHLPFVDDLVNLYVQRPPFELGEAEIRRVLAPGGSAIDPSGTMILRKPWPKQIDEWTHFLHGPDNNAVARDTRIGFPRHAQWIGGPKWARHHDRMASLSAAVSAAGRLFYIMDEGPTASVLAPPDWKLTARDAFNGVTLWKRAIPEWYPHLWPLKSGPAWLPRRLVASGGHVYVTLGLHAPVAQLDAATGTTIRTYRDTGGAGEILFDDGLLLVTVDESPERPAYKPRAGAGMTTAGIERDMAARDYPWNWAPRRVMAIRASTG
ncbi:MAG: hypothetical protein ACYTFI_15305, partial [Planctomycetota bacterium]